MASLRYDPGGLKKTTRTSHDNRYPSLILNQNIPKLCHCANPFGAEMKNIWNQTHNVTFYVYKKGEMLNFFNCQCDLPA